MANKEIFNDYVIQFKDWLKTNKNQKEYCANESQ